MATLKTIKNSYDLLTKKERFILYDAAENRDDQNEMDAIMLATPNEDWIKPDFAWQAEQILKMRLVMLVERLRYCREAMFWFSLMVEEELTDKGKTNDRFFYDIARLNAYFYCVIVESSHLIFEEIGLDVEAWQTKEKQLFSFDFVDEMTDKQMRNLAFDEKEAEAFLNKVGKKRGIEKIVLGFTFEKEVKNLRESLKTQGFAEFFKN